MLGSVTLWNLSGGAPSEYRTFTSPTSRSTTVALATITATQHGSEVTPPEILLPQASRPGLDREDDVCSAQVHGFEGAPGFSGAHLCPHRAVKTGRCSDILPNRVAWLAILLHY